MRGFTLVDGQGTYLQAMMCGSNAQGGAVVEGQRVIVYYGVLVAGRNMENGRLWVYNSSYVSVLSEGHSVPSLQQLVDLSM